MNFTILKLRPLVNQKTLKKVKIYVMNWKKIFSTCITNKKVIKTYKEPWEIIRKGQMTLISS